MGNCCGGGPPVQHQSPEITKPSIGVSRKQYPENDKKTPMAVVEKPTVRNPPKFTPPKTGAHKVTEAGRKMVAAETLQKVKPVPAVETRQNKVTENEQRAKPEDLPATGKIVTPNLKMFTLEDLKLATRNFRPDTMLGEGGFGRVFKGWVDETTLGPSKVGVGMPVAVKKSNPDSIQGLHEWQSEVRFLGKFYHPNLVRLLGYCWEENQFLLVYEYMPRGSLENHLFTKGAEPLSWGMRLKIATGAALGLAFLHNSEKSVIYRDFKASNILLDSDFNAKLSDFGLAKLGPVNGNSHVTTRVMGTYGYAAPEYMATGHLYVRSDVYGFGVVVLEILTGLRALDATRPTAQQNLVEWAKPILADMRKLKKIIDPRLEHKYPLEAVVRTAKLITRCLESDPKNRPSMDDVLRVLREIKSIKEEPNEIRTRGNELDRFQSRSHDSKTGRTNRSG